MGRKAGGKNFGNFQADVDEVKPVLVTEEDKNRLPDIFTSIDKDFITVKDLQDTSGLSYDTCCKIVRQIKSVSDIFHIAGCVHRTDYYLYLSFRMEILKSQPLAAQQTQTQGI
jgi:hypothetical protein